LYGVTCSSAATAGAAANSDTTTESANVRLLNT